MPQDEDLVLPPGLYERIVTSEISSALAAVQANYADGTAADIDLVREAAAALIVAEVRATLAQLHKVSEIGPVVEKALGALESSVRPADNAKTLLSVTDTSTNTKYEHRPIVALNRQALLTNAQGNSYAGHLQSELKSADAVDILMSFVKVSGIAVLEADLAMLAARGVPIRLITTTYIGATDRKAIMRMANEFGAEVRVDYDGAEERLHAKTWIIHRNSGHSTAIVGSSNASRPAMLTGREWNVRLSKTADPDLFNNLCATFNTYWHSNAFRPFNPDTDTQILDLALERARGTADKGGDPFFYVDVEPRQHQKQMLDDLRTAREMHGRHRNLVVAATGTGKTILAALDYKRAAVEQKRRPRLLFVAHREEILNQSIAAFRAVLADGNFGELWVAGKRPVEFQHVFASIQTLTSNSNASIDLSAFEWVIVDEFHHAAAQSYRKLLDSISPVELLGLTATPERTDQTSVQNLFFDGHIAAELRLWDALSLDLLSPFIYFGIGDDTDVSKVQWSNSQYNLAELSDALITNESVRNRLLLRELNSKVPNPKEMRAIAFCASVRHAERTAAFLNSAGISAVSITGDTPSNERSQAMADLRSGALQCLTAVDVLGEGIDIPAVDTIIMLRPTESPLVFIQQLGRGLRKSPEKTVTVVLDFVLNQNVQYRYDRKFEALTGLRRKHLLEAVDSSFPNLTAGCVIKLDQIAQQYIVENLRQQIAPKRKALVAEIASHGNTNLLDYLDVNKRSLVDVYSRGSWSELCIEAGLIEALNSDLESELLKRVRNFRFASDPMRQQIYRACINGSHSPWHSASATERRLQAMFAWNLFPDAVDHNFRSISEPLNAIEGMNSLRQELLQMLDWAHMNPEFAPDALGDKHHDLPLMAHARYTRYELLAAVDYARFAEQANIPKSVGANTHREGTYHASNLGLETLFVSIGKTAAVSSPADRFKDYALSPTTFHWESQPNTSITSPTGQRYVNQKQSGTRMLLAVRESEKSELGTEGFLLLGTGIAKNFIGSKPIHMEIALDHEIPSRFFTGISLEAIS